MYERGVEFLQERESRLQAEQERLVPNFTPASFTLDHVELAEAAELGAKDPEAMYRRSQLQQQQREQGCTRRRHICKLLTRPSSTSTRAGSRTTRHLNRRELLPPRAPRSPRCHGGGPPMTAVAAANAAAARQAARMARTPVRPSFRAFVRKSEEHLGRREARRAAGLLAEEARRMEGCTFTPQLYKPPRQVRPRYPSCACRV